jgi:hypothetical protein
VTDVLPDDTRGTLVNIKHISWFIIRPI